MFALERAPVDTVVCQINRDELQYLVAACRELFEVHRRRDSQLGELLDNLQDIAKEKGWVV